MCNGNACRSQMAEGWTNHLKDDAINCRSARIETHGFNPMALKTMAEAGVGITHHESELAGDFMDEKWDFAVTVCGYAHEACPLFRDQSKIVHVGFYAPPASANGESIEEGTMTHCRKVRDEIRTSIEPLPESSEK